MSPPKPEFSPSKIRGFFRGLGELSEFLRESALAVLEVAIGRWPRPSGDPRPAPIGTDRGVRSIKKIAPVRADD